MRATHHGLRAMPARGHRASPSYVKTRSVSDPVYLPRLRVGRERRREEAEDDGRGERNAAGHHASTALCWPGTAAIFRQPSTLCNVITSLTKGR